VLSLVVVPVFYLLLMPAALPAAADSASNQKQD